MTCHKTKTDQMTNIGTLKILTLKTKTEQHEPAYERVGK